MRVSFFIPLAFFLLSTLRAPASDCSRLRDTQLTNTTITAASAVAPGTFHPPYGGPVSKLPAFCRVAGVIRPSTDSEIRFEVWMPETGWNGKYLGVGNGGFAGTIDFRTLGANLKGAFATAATDTGHQAEAGDATWAYKHPEKVVDFGWRALHLATQNAKQLIAAYYGSPARHSYFDSCSDGGREALMEAQRFPDDFEGILAGAPANYWTALVSSGAFLLQHLNDSAAFISDLKLPAISDAVLAACGSQSGVTDGFVNNPPHCRFNPDVLLCKDRETLTCLTTPQLSLLKAVYAGAIDAQGRQVFPGHPPGGELGPGGWGTWILGGSPGDGFGSGFYRNYFRYVIFEDPTWNPFSGSFESDLRTANQKTEQALNATNPDLHAFQLHGGKLILYHGWSDPAIPPKTRSTTTTAFAERWALTRPQSSFASTWFLACSIVSAAPARMHSDSSACPPQARVPATHWSTGLKTASLPGDLIATNYADDHFGDVVQRTRPLCVCPKVAKYKGIGDPNDAKNFICASE